METYQTAGRLVIQRPCPVVSGENVQPCHHIDKFLSVKRLDGFVLYIQG